MVDENLILKQKVAQDRVDVAAHLNTIASREAEILTLRTEVKRVSITASHADWR